jgi:phage terminase large subunit
MSSAILKQLQEYKEAAKIHAEWTDLVSVEEIASKTQKSIRMVKDLLEEKGLSHKAKLGKSYMYSKTELLKAIRATA